MSSSRSAASVRAKRAGPQPEQTFGRASGPGPVTSIGSTQIFNSGGNTTGANARIHGPGASASANSAKTPVRDVSELSPPIPGGKMSVNSAIALITTRLGRLELFMHQYNLEDRGGSFSGEPILTRLTELENVVAGLKAQTQTQTQGQKSSKETDGGSNLLLLTRIVALEKQVSSSSPASVNPTLFNGLKTEVDGVKTSVSSFSEEIKELKDMLLRLQAYTMETNAKLVNTMFPLYDTVNVQDFDNSDEFLYAQEVDDLCYSDDQADDYVGEESVDETDRLLETTNNHNSNGNKNGISVVYNENPNTFTPNLKELINQELMNCSSRI
jgi:hypothetical protein